MKNVRTVFRMALITSILFWLPLCASAADAPPRISEMWTVVPKADQRGEFFEALKEHMDLRAEAGDPRLWMTYVPILGDQIDMVGIRACCFHWADVDSYREWSASAEAVDKHWQEKVDPFVKNYGHYYDEVNWKNSNIRGEWGPYRVYAATEFTLKNDKAGQFAAARDEISQIALNQGWATREHPWIWSSSVGGAPKESLVIPMKNYAGLERGDTTFFNFLSDVMGSDEAASALLQRFNEAVEKQVFQIWELREDLSMMPAGN